MCFDALQYLEEKEQVWNRKCALASEYKLPVLSCSLNLPAYQKQRTEYIQLAKQWYQKLLKQLAKSGTRIVCDEQIGGLLGFIAVAVVEADPAALKKICIDFERSEVKYRLLDADVMDSDGHQLSREQFGFPPRRCYVCGLPAKLCAAGSLHSEEEVAAAIESMINDR